MIKIGVIGLGEVSQLMHLPILQDLCDKYEVTAITDVSKSLVDFVGDKYSISDRYLSAEKLIEESDTNAILILSPDQYHGRYIKLALEKGKHIFVEKPVTLCVNELNELIEYKKKFENQIVMIGYMRRYANPYLKAKEILAKDKPNVEYLRFRDIICEGPFYIGQTRPIFYPQDVPKQIIEEGAKLKEKQLIEALGVNATKEQKKAYTMLTGLGVHSLSAVRELFGNPKKVCSVTTNFGGEQLIVVLEYDGYIATYELVNNQNVVQFDAAIEIFYGYKKLKIKYETPYIRYTPATLEVIDSKDEETITTNYGPCYVDPFQTELEEFYNCVLNQVEPKTPLEDALEDYKLFEEIIKVMGKEG